MSYEKNQSLQTRLLWELSLVLKHNFSADIAAKLPGEFTINAPDATLELQERIGALQEQNKLLAARLDEGRGMMRKGEFDNVYVYGKLGVWVRGISEGNS